MRTSWIKNGLVVAVTLLFVGIGIQPAIAVNPVASDNEEDCDICPKVSNQQVVRLKSLINRVETLDNKLSVMSKLNPEVEEKYQELSDKITILTKMSKELNFDWNFPIICGILRIIAEFSLAVGMLLYYCNFNIYMVGWRIWALFWCVAALGTGIGCWGWIIPDWFPDY